MWLNSRIIPRTIYRIFCCCMSIILRWKNECEGKRENLFQFFISTFFFHVLVVVVASGWSRELKYIFFQTHTADLKKHALVSSTNANHPHFIFLTHTLQHFFTFNVIVVDVVVVVVCDWSKKRVGNENYTMRWVDGKRKRKTLMWNKSTFNLKWQTQRGEKKFSRFGWGELEVVHSTK